MRSISARFKSRCAQCGGTMAEGGPIEYDDATKRAFHPLCAPQPDERPDPKQIELADRLGFK
jgi:hypothetical protein